MELHNIQTEILKELAFNESSRFADFDIRKTDEVENDRFNYHLQKLVKGKYVIKNEDGSYRIAKLGKDYVNMMSLDGRIKRIKMPKVNVLIFLLDTKDKKTLLAKRLKHPFKNQIGFISGKVEYGESFEKAVSRELQEESGLITEKMKHIGIRRCTDYDLEDNIVHDSVYFIYLVNDFSGELEKVTVESENIWIDLEELEYETLLPVTKQILEEYKQKGDLKKITFYKSMTTKIDVY